MASKETKENIKASRYCDDHCWYSLIRKSQTKFKITIVNKSELTLYNMFDSILKNRNT